MNANGVDKIARIKRSYDLLIEAHELLERSGEDDICAALYLPLGMMEERFDLDSASEIDAMIERKKRST